MRGGSPLVESPTRWRTPAEWEPHEGCLMAWPTRRDLWGDLFERAKREYAAVAAAIARLEPLTMVAQPGCGEEVRRMVDAEIDVIELPIDGGIHRRRRIRL